MRSPGRILNALLSSLCFGTPLHAAADSPAVLEAARAYVECTAGQLRLREPVSSEGDSGFGIVVKDKPYFFEFRGRAAFALDSPKDGAAVVQVLVDQPVNRKFREQASWREYYLQDVAERAGERLEQRELDGGLKLLTLNKSQLKGKAAGLSLLIDAKRNVMVQWNWDMAGRYASASDVRAVQDALWQELGACLSKR